MPPTYLSALQNLHGEVQKSQDTGQSLGNPMNYLEGYARG